MIELHYLLPARRRERQPKDGDRTTLFASVTIPSDCTSCKLHHAEGQSPMVQQLPCLHDCVIRVPQMNINKTEPQMNKNKTEPEKIKSREAPNSNLKTRSSKLQGFQTKANIMIHHVLQTNDSIERLLLLPARWHNDRRLTPPSGIQRTDTETANPSSSAQTGDHHGHGPTN